MGAYITAANLFTTFGERNVRTYADLDGDEDLSKIDANIDAAITFAEAYVEDRLRDAQYEIPFASSGESSGAFESLKYAIAEIAGCKLYIARGFRDNEVQENRMTGHREEAEKFLDRVASGQIRLALVRTEKPNSPSIV